MGLVRLPFQSLPVSHLWLLTLLYPSLRERGNPAVSLSDGWYVFIYV